MTKKILTGLIVLLILSPLGSCFSQKKNTTNTSFSETISRGETLLVEGKKFENAVSLIDQEKSTPENGNIYRYDIGGAVIFRKCHFQKSFALALKNGISSYYATIGQQVFFDSCYFWGDVDFRGLVVKGTLNFNNCIFNGNANFEELECASNAWFLNCFFKKEVRFQNAFFNRKANFFATTFDSICSFQSAFFNQEAQFSNTKFWKYTDYSLCVFNSGSFFNYTTFFDRAIFNNAQFRDRVEFLGATFKAATEMRSCKFWEVAKFEQAKFIEMLDLSDSRFMTGKPRLPSSVNATVLTKDVNYAGHESLQ